LKQSRTFAQGAATFPCATYMKSAIQSFDLSAQVLKR
jgi:hypothetical protein